MCERDGEREHEPLVAAGERWPQQEQIKLISRHPFHCVMLGLAPKQGTGDCATKVGGVQSDQGSGSILLHTISDVTDAPTPP